MTELTATELAYVEDAQRHLARWGYVVIRRLDTLPWLTDSRCRAIVRAIVEADDRKLTVERRPGNPRMHLVGYRRPSYWIKRA